MTIYICAYIHSGSPLKIPILQLPSYVAVFGTPEGALMDITLAGDLEGEAMPNQHAVEPHTELDGDDLSEPEVADIIASTDAGDFTILSHSSRLYHDNSVLEYSDNSESMDTDGGEDPTNTVSPCSHDATDVHQEDGQQLQPPMATATQPLYGYCIIGDNIDKNVRPRHQTLSSQTRSLHMFHAYAALDRIDLLGLSDQPPPLDVPVSIDPDVLLPQQSDMDCALSRCTTLMSRYIHRHKHMHACMCLRELPIGMHGYICLGGMTLHAMLFMSRSRLVYSRILVQQCPQLAGQRKFVEWHIPHKHSREMSKKSVTVSVYAPSRLHLLAPCMLLSTVMHCQFINFMHFLQHSLGVINRSENVTWEMADIMTELQKFVPSFKQTSGDFVCQAYWKTLFCGDQLTCERARGAQKSRRSELLPEGKLRGLIPISADWHAKMCFLQVYIHISNI